MEYELKAQGASESIPLHFLENRELHGKGSSTFARFSGYWKKGEVKENAEFSLFCGGNEIPIQTSITAWWPDGSVKWSEHTADFNPEEKIWTSPVVEYGRKPAKLVDSIVIFENDKSILVDTGAIQTEIYKTPREDGSFIGKTVILGRTAIASGRLVFVLEESAKVDGGKAGNCIFEKRVSTETTCFGNVEEAVIEERGKLSAVIKLTGSHYDSENERKLMPFVVRLTFNLNDPFIHIQHSFVYDGKPESDRMKALGIQFDTPLSGQVYNRHVLFSGEIGEKRAACFHESSKLMLSWHPKIQPSIYPDQIQGKPLLFNPCDETSRAVDKVLSSIPAWNSYRIFADSAHHYRITKGTGKKGCVHINSLEGRRTDGSGVIAGEDGGIMVGIRDFWQKYPSSIWFENISSSGTSGDDIAKTFVWLWSPEAQPMDFSRYDTEGHSGSYYEGFDQSDSDPYGIANTNEILIGGFLPHDGKLIPSEDEIHAFTKQCQKPPMLVSTPKFYHDSKAFGFWSLPDSSTEKKAQIEKNLSDALEFYKNEVEQRSWYGFWDYGDFMHTYDPTRHCWRYDMGGYAWQNTELVPTLWLWYSFLRTGREDVYTLAEAMSRQTSEVDVYHIGKYKGIGSRHNVLHWGCSCKEPRIAMAGHHRVAFYIGGDRRYSDIFDIVKDGDLATLNIDPLRFFYDKSEMKLKTHARTGPDWSTYSSNWLTEWERHQNKKYEEKLKTGIEDLKKAPLGLVSGNNFEYDPESGHLGYIGENSAGGTHLAVCMGGPQTWFELTEVLDDDEWNKLLADFGSFYFADKEEQRKRSNGLIGNREFSLPFMAASIGAYAARYFGDVKLAKKVWEVLLSSLHQNGSMAEKAGTDFEPRTVSFANNASLKEIPWVTTNVTSQYCLNAIVCLELIGGELGE